jgi:hypothetical protein
LGELLDQYREVFAVKPEGEARVGIPCPFQLWRVG